jgi:chromate reductase
MSKSYDVVTLVGSLRRDSFTRRMAEAMTALAPAVLRFETIAIGDLALYDQDLEADAPEPWRRLRERVRRADAVFFATPEYNRSVPACLKNAVDVGSRPYGENVWQGKPAAVASMSPGAIGGFGAHHHLRQTLVAVGMSTLPQPEVYLGQVDRMLDATGAFVDARQRDFAAGFMNAFAAWVERHATRR